MACVICGDPKTVRSHIIPKALALDVRNGAPHVLAASRSRAIVRPMQGGPFSDHLLCNTHESATAAIDKYAVEFVRRVNGQWKMRGGSTALRIQNPDPEALRRFALLTIWREVYAKQESGLSLGPYSEALAEYIFANRKGPSWPIVAQRTNFTLPEKSAVDFTLHPFRVRFADRSAWTFTVAGVAFFVISDRRGLPPIFSDWAVDRHDPAPITVSDPISITDVGMLKQLISKIAERKSR